MQKTRIDKWLWSVRIFKSRTLATNACKANKIKVGESSVKASLLIETGTTIHVRKNGFDLQFEVLKIIDKRVSATLAQPCYKNITPQEELNKYKSWFIGKAASEIREKGVGRPTKRERRTIDDYKDDQIDQFFDFNDID